MRSMTLSLAVGICKQIEAVNLSMWRVALRMDSDLSQKVQCQLGTAVTRKRRVSENLMLIQYSFLLHEFKMFLIPAGKHLRINKSLPQYPKIVSRPSSLLHNPLNYITQKDPNPNQTFDYSLTYVNEITKRDHKI